MKDLSNKDRGKDRRSEETSFFGGTRDRDDAAKDPPDPTLDREDAAGTSVFRDDDRTGDDVHRDDPYTREDVHRDDRYAGEDMYRDDRPGVGLRDRDVATGNVESSHAPLFPGEDSDRFRDRWGQIQTNFVDEPRQAVEQADELVSEVTERLTSVFTRNRDELEQQWAAGDEVSTEELRRTLQRYRSFFERLLSM